MTKIPVEISARHLHLSQKDLETLFGQGYQLNKVKDLSQPGEFSAEETVELFGSKSSYSQVRVVGPIRKHTQVELTATDCRILGIEAPLRLSGDVTGSGKAKLVGPKGEVELKEGVIIPKRHLHLSSQDANNFGLKTNDQVSIKLESERGVTFHNIIVRSGEKYSTACHLDTDESNAAGLKTCTQGELII